MKRAEHCVLSARQRPAHASAQGFISFEWIGTVLIIGILATVLLHYLLRYQDIARATVMEATIANMRSGLRLRVAELMMANRNAEIGELVHENPIDWLETPPPNYLGAMKQIDPERIPPDSWYFDANQHELVYLLPESTLASTAQGERRHLHIRVIGTSSQRGNLGTGAIEGVALIATLEK